MTEKVKGSKQDWKEKSVTIVVVMLRDARLWDTVRLVTCRNGASIIAYNYIVHAFFSSQDFDLRIASPVLLCAAKYNL